MNAPWLLVQHVAWEGPGLIAEEATLHRIELRVVRTDLKQDLPTPEDLVRLYGGLIVMGGPMSANDTTSFPNLDLERHLLAIATTEGFPVLGVCLGAQLLAAALGARVYRGDTPEVGFGKVHLTPEGKADAVMGSTNIEVPVFHWHEETFDLPTGSVLLASTEWYRNQAFRVGARAYGFQFHVEVNIGLAEAWAPHLPSNISIEIPHRAKVERAGRRILGRFFETVGNNRLNQKKRQL